MEERNEYRTPIAVTVIGLVAAILAAGGDLWGNYLTVDPPVSHGVITTLVGIMIVVAIVLVLLGGAATVALCITDMRLLAAAGVFVLTVCLAFGIRHASVDVAASTPTEVHLEVLRTDTTSDGQTYVERGPGGTHRFTESPLGWEDARFHKSILYTNGRWITTGWSYPVAPFFGFAFRNPVPALQIGQAYDCLLEPDTGSNPLSGPGASIVACRHTGRGWVDPERELDLGE